MPWYSTIWTYALAFITVAAAIYGSLNLFERIKEKLALRNINNKLMPRLEQKTKKFLKEELLIDYDRQFKAIKGTNSNTDSTIMFPIYDPQHIKSDDCPINVIEIVVTQVKQAAISVLSERNYDPSAIKDCSSIIVEEFLEKKIYESEIKNETTKREIKTMFVASDSAETKDIIRTEFSIFKKLIKNKTPYKEFNAEYKKRVGTKQPEHLTFPLLVQTDSELIKKDKSEGDKVLFAPKSVRVMKTLKEQRLKNYEDFVNFYRTIEDKRRCEQIFGIILDKWGSYIVEMYNLSRVPVSTLSRYITTMEEEELVVKIPRYGEHFFRKEIYPLFTQKEIENNYDELAKSDQIAIFGKVQKNADASTKTEYYLDKFPNINIIVEDKYLGENVVVAGQLCKTDNKISLQNIHIHKR